jgi:pimeloyl-ACP methyl ester carboxylesterase
MIVTSGTASIAVEDRGDGDATPALLLHAGVTDKRSWAPLIELLAPQRRCIAYDVRGFGETTATPEDVSLHGDAIAVLDACGVDRAVVVAASMGGRTAIDLTLAHPDRVAALVLIGAAISGSPGVDADRVPPEQQRLLAAVDAAEAAHDLAEVNRLEAWLWLDGAAAPEGRVGGDVRELFLAMNAIALAAPDLGELIRPEPAWPRLEQITCPTLVIVGSLDLDDVRHDAHALADRVQGARLVELAGTAHLPHMEIDPACRRIVADFLASLATERNQS